MKRSLIYLIVLLSSTNSPAGNYKGVYLQMGRLDANHDGRISLEEFTAARKKQREEAGLKFLPKVTANAFKIIDKDGDGYIMRTELANSEIKENKGKSENLEKEVRVFIKTRDADKDGRVSQKEYLNATKRKVKSGGGNYRPKKAKNKFDSIDQNGDGYLDAKEVEKYKK